MRVLMLSNLWPPSVLGGAELYASTLADRLRGRGLEVGAVTLGIDGDDVVATVPSWPHPLQTWSTQPMWKRQLFQLGDVYDPVAARIVRRAIERFAPDVVHSHAVTGMSVAALAEPSRAGVAHVHTVHDYWYLCRRNTLAQSTGQPCEGQCRICVGVSAVRKATLRRHPADVTIVPSNAVARVHDRLAFPLADVRLVHHPGEEPRVRSRRPTPGGPLVFGFIGQLNPNKGVRTLLAAAAAWSGDPIEVLVAGKGQLAPEVEAAGAPVRGLGWVEGEAKEAFFDAIDCLVVPSEWEEPAGLINLEARARGIPVIGADIGGVPEYVPTSCRDLLFRPGDAASLAASMRAFAADPDRFVPAPEDRPATWEEHLDAVLGCYAEARARRGRTEVHEK